MKKIITFLFIIFSVKSFAQKNDSIVNKNINEITVESFFFNQKTTSSTSPISVITANEINKIPIQSIGDALKLKPAIDIKSDGVWSTAPSIRGLSGQHIVVAIDGNRIETATDVSGGMNMINLNDISQIDIIKSGASAVYGSGAVGGVINFITQPVTYSSEPEFHATVSSSYQSVNNLFDEYAKFYGSTKRIFYSLSGSFRHADDAMTPVGILENSQFKDFSVSAKAGFRINDHHKIHAQHQNFQARNVGVPGGNTFNDKYTVTFPDHARAMTDIQYIFSQNTNWFRQAKVKLYHQGINRNVLIETNMPMYAGKPITLAPKAKHNLFGCLTQADMNFNDYKVTAGLDIWQRNLESTRKKFISQPDSSEMIRGERPLPKASYMSNSLFARAERNFFDNKLKTTIGARYDFIIVNNNEVYDPEYVYKNEVLLNVPRRLTIEAGTEQMHSWSANIGANYEIINGLNIALSGGHSFRAPNIEELYKYINLGSLVEIGNPDLKPEQSYFADLGLHYKCDKFSFSTNGFINNVNNLITSVNGKTTYDNYGPNGNVTSTDTMNAKILNNIEQALLYGADISINYEPISDLNIYANAAYTIGQNITTGEYLPLMAPVNGILGLNYNGWKYLQGDINCKWAGQQNKIAKGETMTPGYATLNLNLNSMAFTFSTCQLQLFAGVHNLLNTKYTNHLSTNRGSITIEPGRNFYLKLRFNI